MSDLKVGDAVKLSASPQKMNITSIVSDGMAVCDWVGKDGTPYQKTYPLAALTKAELKNAVVAMGGSLSRGARLSR